MIGKSWSQIEVIAAKIGRGQDADSALTEVELTEHLTTTAPAMEVLGWAVVVNKNAC